MSRFESRLAVPAVALWAVVLALGGASCRGGSSGRGVIVAGSTSIQPFADRWAEVFMRENPGKLVNVQGGGSSAGIEAARSGAADIGMSSRELKPEERDLSEIVIARDGLAVIVHPSNPLSGLELFEVRNIFNGSVRNWRMLDGADAEVTVVTREEGSGTRGAFQELVMDRDRIFRGAVVEDSNGTVREIVASDPNSIGYISLGLVNEQVKPLALEGVQATKAEINAGRYRLVRPFLFVTKGPAAPASGDFISFVLSPEGQRLIIEEGLLPALAE